MNLIDLVIAMAIVTYIPRMLPLVLLQNVTLPDSINRFMKFIPYAALGSLIFPAVLTSTGANHPEAAIVGGIVALVLAWFEINLILIVAGGITGACLLLVW